MEGDGADDQEGGDGIVVEEPVLEEHDRGSDHEKSDEPGSQPGREPEDDEQPERGESEREAGEMEGEAKQDRIALGRELQAKPEEHVEEGRLAMEVQDAFEQPLSQKLRVDVLEEVGEAASAEVDTQEREDDARACERKNEQADRREPP